MLVLTGSKSYEFQSDGCGNTFASFDGLPSNQPKRVIASTELTGKGVRRIMLKVEIPFVKGLLPDSAVAHYDVVSAHIVLNVPNRNGLQLSESTEAQVDAGAATAVATALSVLTSIITDQPVEVDSASIKDLNSVACRGSNGFYPVDPSKTFGDVDNSEE